MADPAGSVNFKIALDLTDYQKALRSLMGNLGTVGTSAKSAGEAGADGMDKMSASTQAARRELVVMMHELLTGNVKNFVGSLTVMGEHLDSLMALLTPVNLGIAAVGAAALALGVAAYQGAEQYEAFNKALQATGGYAGVSVDQLSAMAANLEQLGVPAGKANETLAQVVSTGKISADAIESVATASSELSEATGEDAKQFVQQFAEMSGNVADGAAKMSEQYHFLTTAQYDEIKALQQHGDQAGAMKVAADALTGSLEGMKVPLSGLPKLLHEARDAWNDFWQAAQNVGKPETPRSHVQALEDELSTQQGVLARSNQSNAGPLNIGTGVTQRIIAGIQGELPDAKHDADLHDASAQIAGYLKQLEQGGLDASRSVDKLSESLDKNYAKTKALADLNRDFDAMWSDPSDPNHQNSRLRGVTRGANGSYSGGEYGSLVKGINDKYADKSAAATDKATLQQQVDAVRQALSKINDEYRNSESVLEAAHNAGTVSDADFYQAQRDQLAASTNAQAAQLENELSILRQHKASGAERIQIDKQIQDVEAQLQKLYADTGAKFQKSVTDETTAQAKRKAALSEYTGALQQQIDTQQNAIDIQVASVGLGSQEAQQLQQLNSLQRSYDSQRTRLAEQMARVPVGSDQYKSLQDEMTALQAANVQAVAVAQDGFTRMRAAQGNWENGAVQAFQNYADSAQNVAAETSKAFTDLFSGMEDALVQFVTTGKLNFSQLAQSVIADIVRMQVRAAESSLFGSIGSMLGLNLGASAVGANTFGFTMPTDIAGSGALFGVGAGIVSRAGGGSVWGPGSGTSDSINARLSDGEFVVRSSVASQPGMRSLLTAINGGATISGGNRFANGGPVFTSGASAVQPNVNVTVQNAPAGTQVQRSTGPGGVPDIKVILPLIDQHIAGGIQSGKSSTAKVLQTQYGLNRAAGIG